MSRGRSPLTAVPKGAGPSVQANWSMSRTASPFRPVQTEEEGSVSVTPLGVHKRHAGHPAQIYTNTKQHSNSLPFGETELLGPTSIGKVFFSLRVTRSAMKAAHLAVVLQALATLATVAAFSPPGRLLPAPPRHGARPRLHWAQVAQCSRAMWGKKVCAKSAHKTHSDTDRKASVRVRGTPSTIQDPPEADVWS